MSVIEPAVALRQVVQQFVRGFGLLTEERTPCGQRLSVSEAHTLMLLLQSHQDREPPLLKDLGEVLGIDKSNVGRLCREMEKRGWLQVVPCPVDGRARRLFLTVAGRRRARIVEAASRAKFEALIQALPDQSAAVTIAALENLNAAIQSSSVAVALKGKP